MTYITSSPNQSEYAQSNVTECCSVVNKCLGSASEGAPYSPHRAGHPLHTIPQAFERMNAPQIRRDRFAGALPPVWLMVIAAGTCLFTLLVADTLYREFFEWMTGV